MVDQECSDCGEKESLCSNDRCSYCCSDRCFDHKLAASMLWLLLIVSLALSGCAAYQRLWKEQVALHGICMDVCDNWAKHTGAPMPVSFYLKKTEMCRCWSPLAPYEPDYPGRPEAVEIRAPKLGDSL